MTAVELDTQNAVLESNEVNNLEIFPVSVAPAVAELVVTDIVATPTPAIEDAVTQLAVTVQNAGNVATGAFLVELSPGLFVPPLTLQVNALAAGASTTLTFAHTYPGPGNVSVTATVDSTNTVAESNEFNNVRTEQLTVVVATVDLVVTAISFTPTPVVQGRPSQVTITLRNDGNSPAGPFTARVKPAWFAPDLTAEIQNLGPGAETSRTFDYTFPFAGTFTADAAVDTGFAIAETNEFNNGRQQQIVVEPPLPDLEISNVTVVPVSPVAGLTSRADITVVNTGNDPAGVFLVRWRPSFFGPDKSIQVNGLAVGESKTVSIEHTFGFAGMYFGDVMVDSTEAVPEVSEANNTVIKVVDVQAPFVDLVMVDLVVVPPLAADLPATAQITIRNDGNFPAGKFQLTWKPSPFAPDRNVLVDGLAPGETKVIELVHTYGSPGVLITTTATVDSANQITESNETNNTITKQVDVAPVGPDLVVSSIVVLGRDGPGGNFETATQGVPLTARITVANQGNRPAGPFELEWNPGVPAELITQGPATVSSQVQGLAAGATTFVDFVYSYPASGNFRSVALVDAFDDVTEANEANNFLILNFEVSIGIDLDITNFQVLPPQGFNQVFAQSEARAEITVTNSGFFPARNFTVSWNPTEATTNFFNPSKAITELLPGQSTTVAISTSYPFAGTFTTGATVDSFNAVVESDETNNTATTTVTVVPRAATVQIQFQSLKLQDDLDDGLNGEAEPVVAAGAFNPGSTCTAVASFADKIGGFLDDLFGIDVGNIPAFECSVKEYSIDMDGDSPWTLGLDQTVTVNLADPVPLIVVGVIGEEDEPLVGEVGGLFFDVVDFNTVLTGPTRTVQRLDIQGAPNEFDFSDVTYKINVLSGPPPIFQP